MLSFIKIPTLKVGEEYNCHRGCERTFQTKTAFMWHIEMGKCSTTNKNHDMNVQYWAIASSHCVEPMYYLLDFVCQLISDTTCKAGEKQDILDCNSCPMSPDRVMWD